MARVTTAEVKEIIKIDSNIVPDVNIAAFITAANRLTTDALGTSGLASATLKEIERWLAAHFITAADRRSLEEEADEIRQKFTVKVGLGLRNSHYGQAAIALDTTGILAQIADGKGANETVFDSINIVD